MKQVCLFIIALFAGSISLYAQSEAQGDSIRSHVLPDGTPPEGALMPEVKNYDGFLLDMSLLKMEAPRLPEFTLEIPDASKDYSRMFRLNPNATYSQGLSNVFSLTNSTVYSMNPFGLSGFWSSPENLQMGSFRLKNGMRINTYGEYDKDGWKVPNHSALPWEKNNFKGAFEIFQRCVRHTHRSATREQDTVLKHKLRFCQSFLLTVHVHHLQNNVPVLLQPFLPKIGNADKHRLVCGQQIADTQDGLLLDNRIDRHSHSGRYGISPFHQPVVQLRMQHIRSFLSGSGLCLLPFPFLYISLHSLQHTSPLQIFFSGNNPFADRQYRFLP